MDIVIRENLESTPKYLIKFLFYSRKKNINFFYHYLLFCNRYSNIIKSILKFIPIYGSWLDLIKLHEQSTDPALKEEIEKIYVSQIRLDLRSEIASNCFKYIPQERKKHDFLRNISRMISEKKKYENMRKIKSQLKKKYPRFHSHIDIIKYILKFDFITEKDINLCEKEWERLHLNLNLDAWKNTVVIVYICNTFDFIVIIIALCILLEKNIFVGSQWIDFSDYNLFMKTHFLYEKIKLHEETNLFEILKSTKCTQVLVFEERNMQYDKQLSSNLKLFDMLHKIERKYTFWTNYATKNVEYEKFSVISGTHTFYINQFIQSQKLKKKNKYEIISENYNQLDSVFDSL